MESAHNKALREQQQRHEKLLADVNATHDQKLKEQAQKYEELLKQRREESRKEMQAMQ